MDPLSKEARRSSRLGTLVFTLIVAGGGFAIALGLAGTDPEAFGLFPWLAAWFNAWAYQGQTDGWYIVVGLGMILFGWAALRNR